MIKLALGSTLMLCGVAMPLDLGGVMILCGAVLFWCEVA